MVDIGIAEVIGDLLGGEKPRAEHFGGGAQAKRIAVFGDPHARGGAEFGAQMRDALAAMGGQLGGGKIAPEVTMDKLDRAVGGGIGRWHVLLFLRQNPEI